MSRSEKDIDVMIREALGRTDAELREEFGEQSLPEMIGGLFRGRRRLEMGILTAIILLFFGASIFCAYRLVSASELRAMLLWGGAFFLCWSSMIGFKMVSWLEMHRNATVREIKRLELQVAQLARQVRAGLADHGADGA